MNWPLVPALRPKQWIKNVLVFAGLIFSRNLFNGPLLFKVALAAGIFCVLSSAVYLLNDVADLKADRVHPEKRKRPLASGRIGVPAMLAASAALFAAGLGSGFGLDPRFGWACLAYAALMVAYSAGLKHVPVVDVLAIAVGFVLRVVAGAVVIRVPVSSWFLAATIFLALFLGLVKRRHELALLGRDARRHRKSLDEYSPALLDQLITVSATASVMSYVLYATSPDTAAKFGTPYFVLTVPFILYGVFRYLYLNDRKGWGGSPEDVFLKDPPMLINCGLYLAVLVLLVYA